MLVRSSNSDKLSNRIVHVSVQLFSNEELALQMTEQLQLLHIMVCSLKNMMNDVLISCELHDSILKRHKVCSSPVILCFIHCQRSFLPALNTVVPSTVIGKQPLVKYQLWFPYSSQVFLLLRPWRTGNLCPITDYPTASAIALILKVTKLSCPFPIGGIF